MWTSRGSSGTPRSASATFRRWRRGTTTICPAPCTRAASSATTGRTSAWSRSTSSISSASRPRRRPNDRRFRHLLGRWRHGDRGAFVITPGLVAAALLTVLVGGFVAWIGYQFVTFARTPELRITEPAGNLSSYTELTITVRGVTAPNASVTVSNLRVNPTVTADELGAFEVTVDLVPGLERDASGGGRSGHGPLLGGGGTDDPGRGGRVEPARDSPGRRRPRRRGRGHQPGGNLGERGPWSDGRGRGGDHRGRGSHVRCHDGLRRPHRDPGDAARAGFAHSHRGRQRCVRRNARARLWRVAAHVDVRRRRAHRPNGVGGPARRPGGHDRDHRR